FSNQDPNNVSPDYSTLQMNFGMGESANGILRHAKVLNTATFLEILNSKGATAKSLYVGAEANTPTNIYKVTNGGKSARQGKTLSDSKAAWSATPPTIGTIERVTQQTIETIVGDK
ncbi:MAG TPA: hypothetical protein VFQ70_02810, partial [Candidatus Saccharimonadaceae bacterium]|nr:hypothetical protein [Candidatus Saccharimonadaceae bacterium]